MKKTIIAIASLLAMAAVQPAMAHGDQHQEAMQEHGHMQGDMSQMKEHSHHDMGKMAEHGQMQGDMQSMDELFLVKKEIDGFTVSFHAMKVKEGMEHGGSHNLMIKVEKDGKALTDLTVNSKVTHPNGKSESKMLMKMGDWYMAGYDLNHTGKHQLMVLFKTADGAKHFGGVYFPADK
ncbi:MAG: hypothetical protein Q9M17_07355 [Mariprofundus sp.]|nr:hypothetical protein [Mariprofundus sp.]